MFYESNSDDENSMLHRYELENQLKTIDRYLYTLEKNVQIARSDSKIAFLKKLKKQLEVRQNDAHNMELLDLMLSSYIIQQHIVTQNIMETAILKFSVFEEMIPYTRNDLHNNKPQFTEFNLVDQQYLEVVLRSDLVDQYLINVIRFKKEQNQKAQMHILREDCLNYFNKATFIRINEPLILYHNIIGYCLHSDQLIISDFYQAYPKIEILLLIHMYFQRYFKLYGFIYQQSKKKSIIEFESEIFPIKFNMQWLTLSRLEYLQNSSNWAHLSWKFVTQLNDSGPIWNPRNVNPVIKTNSHNYLQEAIISWIQEFLRDLTFDPLDTIKLKYLHQRPLAQIPNLASTYTNLQYFTTLKSLIMRAVRNFDRLIELKEYNTQHQPRIQRIFNFLINSTHCNKVSFIQQLLIWIFQCEFDSTVESCGNMCLQIIAQDLNQIKLSDADHELLQIMVNSEGVRKVVMKINSIDGKYTSEQDLEHEYFQLHRFLKCVPIIAFKIKGLMGISLMNSRIAIDLDLLTGMDLKSRALRLITIIHETYCHKKRKDYVSPRNILELTPENLNAQQNRAHQAQHRKVGGECGYYFEEKIFGAIVNSVSLEQALYILDPNNWKKPQQRFRLEFSLLPTAALERANLKQQNLQQAKMEELNYEQELQQKCVRRIYNQ